MLGINARLIAVAAHAGAVGVAVGVLRVAEAKLRCRTAAPLLGGSRVCRAEFDRGVALLELLLLLPLPPIATVAVVATRDSALPVAPLELIISQKKKKG